MVKSWSQSKPPAPGSDRSGKIGRSDNYRGLKEAHRAANVRHGKPEGRHARKVASDGKALLLFR